MVRHLLIGLVAGFTISGIAVLLVTVLYVNSGSKSDGQKIAKALGLKEKEPVAELHCSFCGKSRLEVAKLIAGPSVYIFDECVSLCNDILAEEVEKEKVNQSRAVPSGR